MILLFSSHSLLLFAVSEKKMESSLLRVVLLLILSIDLFFSLFGSFQKSRVRKHEKAAVAQDPCQRSPGMGGQTMREIVSGKG
jgi:hypothetical protein